MIENISYKHHCCQAVHQDYSWNAVLLHRLMEVYQMQKKIKQGTSQKKDRDSNPVSASAGSNNAGEPEDKVWCNFDSDIHKFFDSKVIRI